MIFFSLYTLIERCCKRDINGMAPHLLVSLYTVCSLLLFVKREPNDNNVRLRSFIPFVFCLCIQSSKPKKTSSVFISSNFSVHFLSFLFFLFISHSFSVFTSNYLFIVTFWHFHSSISHWNCYCYLLSYLTFAIHWYGMKCHRAVLVKTKEIWIE